MKRIELYIILVITCTVIFINCKNKITPSNSISKIKYELKISEIDELNQIPLSDLESELQYFNLITPENILIGEVTEMIYFESYFIILDRKGSNKVMLFDEKGYYIRQYGNPGKGPGEYRRADDISIDRTQGWLYIFSSQERKLLTFSIKDGKLINEIQLAFAASEIQPIGNNKFAIFNHDIYNPITNLGDLNYNVLFTDDSFQTILNKQFKSNSLEGQGKSVLVTGRYFYENAGNIYLKWCFNDTTYILNKLSFEPYFQIDFASKKIISKTYEESTSNYIILKLMDGTFHSQIKPTIICSGLFFTSFLAVSHPIKLNEIEDNMYYLVASHKTGRAVKTKIIIDDIYNGIFSFPIGATDNCFISVIYPDDLVKFIEPNTQKAFFKGTNSIVENNMNPIICLFKLNLH